MLRRLLSEYWRKETEKSKVFCGVVGLDGRCSAQAEQRKKPVAVGHLPGAYLSTETNLVPIRGVMRKEFDTGQTHRHTHTHKVARAWKKYQIDFSQILYKCFQRHANCRSEIKNGGHRTKCCTMPSQSFVIFATEIRSFLMVTTLIR